MRSVVVAAVAIEVPGEFRIAPGTPGEVAQIRSSRFCRWVRFEGHGRPLMVLDHEITDRAERDEEAR